MNEGWGDIKPDGWFAHGNWGSKVDDVPPIPKYNDEQPSVKMLIDLAHEILDRVELNLYFMVESIKAKKYPEGIEPDAGDAHGI